jgi:glycosyltransferase involved in cell wall biosynthesis
LSAPPDAPRLAYFALDVPHRGQASHIHISEIVENLRKIGWRVDLFAPKPAADGRTRSLPARLLADFAVIVRIIVQLPKYQAVYLRAHPLGWPVTFAARLLGKVVVQEVNGVELDVIIAHPWLDPFRRFVRWMYASQYRAADHLFPVTEDLGVWLQKIARHGRITVVPNGANTDLFQPIERECPPFAVFFGGLTQWHGVDLMLSAIRHPDWPQNVELVVIGDGARAKDVRDAEAAGLPVRWLGYRAHEQIPELIAGAVAGLIPITNPRGRSSTGISPLKLYETMACGIPAVVTDLPGQAEVVREGRCGLVVPCDDPAALAGAVAQLSSDRELARDMGRRGTEFVRARHSWAARAADIDRVLRRACAAAGG